MKPLITALLISVAAVPAMAQSVDISSIFPPLTYPDPVTEPVTQDDAGIDN